MWVIDLPPSLEGYSCALCAAEGKTVVARHRDVLGAPVCTAHFVSQVRIASMLAAHGHEDSGSEVRKRATKEGGCNG